METGKQQNPHEHKFGCVRTQGTFGEVKISTLLTADQIEAVIKDPARAEVLCPHGSIQCITCRASLVSSSPPQAPSAADLLKKLRP